MTARIAAIKKMTQHSLNAVHIYCRFSDLGMPKKWAAGIARVYEAVIHPVLY